MIGFDVNTMRLQLETLEEERDELSFAMVEAEGEELRDMEDKLEELEGQIEELQFNINEMESFAAMSRVR